MTFKFQRGQRYDDIYGFVNYRCHNSNIVLTFSYADVVEKDKVYDLYKNGTGGFEFYLGHKTEYINIDLQSSLTYKVV